ncbi:unnamed protein product, partial [Ixodes pacificus]
WLRGIFFVGTARLKRTTRGEELLSLLLFSNVNDKRTQTWKPPSPAPVMDHPEISRSCLQSYNRCGDLLQGRSEAATNDPGNSRRAPSVFLCFFFLFLSSKQSRR